MTLIHHEMHTLTHPQAAALIAAHDGKPFTGASRTRVCKDLRRAGLLRTERWATTHIGSMLVSTGLRAKVGCK